MWPTFLPHNYLRTMYQRLQNWSQGKSVNEYTEEFYRLLTLVDLSDSDEQLVSWYIGGLWPQIQDTLNLFDPNNVSTAYQRALLIEKTSVQGFMGTFRHWELQPFRWFIRESGIYSTKRPKQDNHYRWTTQPNRGNYPPQMLSMR